MNRDKQPEALRVAGCLRQAERLIQAQHARIAELEAELEHANQWRDLALQFDGHRMQALWHLKAMVNADTGTLEAKAAGDFLNAGPLPCEQVLAQRIAELAAPAAQAVEPDLYAGIMNLPVNRDAMAEMDINMRVAYKEGHRDARHAAAELALRATPPAPAAVAAPDWVEALAESWDGCMYDAPGETIDIGASIRRAALAARFIRQPA